MIRIITDSVASIPPDMAQERDIRIIPLHLLIDGEDVDETSMDVDAYYGTLEDRIDDIPKSSQPSPFQLESMLEEIAQAGDSVLGVFISSKLSGTYESITRAARMIESHNIDFKCILIDSASAGPDEAFAVLDAADARDKGCTLEECAAYAEHSILSSRYLFMPDSLDFLRAGGRIGAASALLGNMIKIIPILTVKNGQATPFEKVRTSKKAMARMIELFKADVEEHGLKRVVVNYIGKKTEALDRLKEMVQEIAGRAVEVLPVSPVVGSHVGPAIGVAYECLSYVQGKYDGFVGDLVFTA